MFFILSINDKITEIFEELDNEMKDFEKKPTDHYIDTSCAGGDDAGAVIIGNTIYVGDDFGLDINAFKHLMN
ncbi:unnamed protein product [Rotaria sp. Silwood2]|nr:unnamed protein product [Rotaria sp. Silwood2]